MNMRFYRCSPSSAKYRNSTSSFTRRVQTKGSHADMHSYNICTEGDAQTALGSINGKLLRGRKLVVTFAHQAPLEQPGGIRQVGRARRIDARPTTLSMMKSGIHTRSEGTDNKIAMMEAKLRQMESSTVNSFNSLPPKPLPPVLVSASRQCLGSGGSLSSRNLAGPTVRRLTTRVESTAHLGLSAEADTTPSESSTTLYTRPEVVKSSTSCKRLIPGVKIVKERSK
ncbi:hypothetical protein EDB19DRAFT_288657 [Suillus lakei]|nr:hypothetical protein EDB19DRAFT_288657 [Suillus lakei]